MVSKFRIAAALALALAAYAQDKPAPKLSIERLVLTQYEDGPALAPGYQFVPGESAYFSCRLAGFQVQRKDQARTVKLAWEMRVLDPFSLPIDKEKSGRIEESLSAQDKNWVPKFLSTFTVPPFAPTGTYRIPVTVKDEIAAAEVSGELKFEVRGREVEPSPTLITRNVEMVRSEDDKVPMHPAVYHPGDTLWTKFDITGYKFDKSNQFSVDYGLAILNASGEQVFSQPVAASESKASFYPQRYVPGALSLNLDANVAKTNYTLVVTVRDKIGNQTYETRQPFVVQ